MYYGIFHRSRPGAVRPVGFLKEWLETQNKGLSSHFAEQGFPFNTPMWEGGCGKIKLASIVYNDEAAETPSQEAWWPYEQSAYLLDGLLGVGILAGDTSKIGLYERNLRYLLGHPDSNGELGHCYGSFDMEWPMVVFFRSAARYFAYSGDSNVSNAFIRHYLSLSEEKLSKGLRHINNLEGILTAYGWSQDEALLRKAENAYRKHDEYHALHTEIEYELQRSKITSGRNYVIHGVSFSEAIKLPVMLYLYTGDKSYLDDAERGLADVLRRHEQIPGLPSSNEDFAGRDPLQGYETCVIQDFSHALGYFLMATGDGQYADRMEKIFYNAFPGSVLKDFSALQYLSSPNQVISGPGSNHNFFFRGCASLHQFRSDHSAQCCTGNVHRILPGFIFRMWMLDADEAPVAVLYGPSVFQGKDYSITEETDYPFDETLRFRFSMKKSRRLPFTFRIPQWCKQAALRLNGQQIALPDIRNGFCTLEREWNDKDVLEIILPMQPVRKTDRYWLWHECGPWSIHCQCHSTSSGKMPPHFRHAC
ncbi:MAG: glycoside hydrolase family 127 protein [Victivallales bacterium]|nr:glycoside hydrolase family 127 protein [Victivallales bacterium]